MKKNTHLKIFQHGTQVLGLLTHVRQLCLDGRQLMLQARFLLLGQFIVWSRESDSSQLRLNIRDSLNTKLENALGKAAQRKP